MNARAAVLSLLVLSLAACREEAPLPPEAPSIPLTTYRGEDFEIGHPPGWRIQRHEGGMVRFLDTQPVGAYQVGTMMVVVPRGGEGGGQHFSMGCGSHECSGTLRVDLDGRRVMLTRICLADGGCPAEDQLEGELRALAAAVAPTLRNYERAGDTPLK